MSVKVPYKDKTNMKSVPSKDSDQVGHTDFFYSFEPMGPSDFLDPN